MRQTTKALLAACAAFFVLAVMQLCAKLLSDVYHPLEIAFWRNVIGFLLILGYLLIFERNCARLRTSRPMAHLLRAAVGTTGIVFTFAAFAHMPMAETTTLLFTSSLLMPVFGVLFLGEHVGIVRLTAVLVGFSGVALLAGPDTGVDMTGLILGLSAAVFIALVAVILRWMGTSEHPLTTAVYFTGLGALCLLPGMPFFARTPIAETMPLLLGVGISGGLAQILLASIYVHLKPATVAPINYTGLIWSVLFDILIFANIPGWPVFAGAAVIISANVMIVIRENRKRT